MNAVIAAGAGFLAAVLWIHLTFDVQVQRRGPDRAPDEVLTSIAPYYRRVTTGAWPMNWLNPSVLALTLAGILIQMLERVQPIWVSAASLALAAVAIGLGLWRTWRNAVRLGQAIDTPEVQTKLAVDVYRDHLVSLAAMLALVGLQVATSFPF
ncbi:hypothetical protein [Phenylobacterium sp.]|uniref:hypothetical protein n=1 Tax=Phenylobacterium sp. TaxID=1871053 RepID=UPI0025E179A9|nr:hypothetical protein [Phenylobacterium sp.]